MNFRSLGLEHTCYIRCKMHEIMLTIVIKQHRIRKFLQQHITFLFQKHPVLHFSEIQKQNAADKQRGCHQNSHAQFCLAEQFSGSRRNLVGFKQDCQTPAFPHIYSYWAIPSPDQDMPFRSAHSCFWQASTLSGWRRYNRE